MAWRSKVITATGLPMNLARSGIRRSCDRPQHRARALPDQHLNLERLPGRYAVCRLDAAAAVPPWATHKGHLDSSGLVCITRTEAELAIVIDETRVPPDARAERGFIALRLVGIIDFSLVGILARLTGALAQASVPVFVISTFDTDILMVREQFRDRAVAALRTVSQVQGS